MQKRELWKVILFGLITLGIYDLFWMYKTRNEMVAKGQKIPSFWLLFAPLLALFALAIIMFIVRSAASGSPVGEVGAGERLLNVMAMLIGMISVLAIIPISIYWIYMYSKGVEGVTKGRTSTGFSFGLCILLSIFSVGFVWPGLIQDSFNKNT